MLEDLYNYSKLVCSVIQGSYEPTYQPYAPFNLNKPITNIAHNNVGYVRGRISSHIVNQNVFF